MNNNQYIIIMMIEFSKIHLLNLKSLRKTVKLSLYNNKKQSLKITITPQINQTSRNNKRKKNQLNITK